MIVVCLGYEIDSFGVVVVVDNLDDMVVVVKWVEVGFKWFFGGVNIVSKVLGGVMFNVCMFVF